MLDWRLTYHRCWLLWIDFGVTQEICSFETSNFCLPPCPSMFILNVTSVPPQHMFALVSYPSPSQKWQCFYTDIYIYMIKIKIFASHKKKFEKMEIGLTHPPFVSFRLLFKRTQPNHDERWTLHLKKIRGAYICKDKK